MARRRIAVALVLVVLALVGGCVDAPPAQDEDKAVFDDAAAVLPSFDLAACQGYSVLHLEPRDVVQELVPAPLEVAQYGAAGLASQQAVLAFEVLDCGEVTGLDNVSSVRVARTFTFVRPNVEISGEEGGDHQYVFEMLVESDAPPMWTAFMSTFEVNEILLEPHVPGEAGSRVASAADYRLETVVRPPDSDHGSFRLVWYHHSETDGWRVLAAEESFPDDSEATGSFVVPEGSLFAPFSEAGRLVGPGYHYGSATFARWAVVAPSGTNA